MSSFFTVPAAQKKRKRDGGEQQRSGARKPTKEFSKPVRKVEKDEEISGSESEDDDGPRRIDEDDEVDESSGDEEETAAETRRRLAERYLEKARAEIQEEVGFDAEEIDAELLAERLREDVAETKGKIYRSLATEFTYGEARHTTFRGNDSQSMTGIAVCAPYCYTVSKDMCLTKWRIQVLPKDQYPKKTKKAKKLAPPRTRPEKIKFVRGDKRRASEKSYQGHVGSILCVAASEDGKFVVTGGQDRRIIVWDADLKPLRVFGQHRDAVTSIAFRKGTNQMFSASSDRTIKVWSLDELAYVETLFGHQDAVLDIAALSQEKCVSVGGRDRTARLWKVVEESQLVFRGGGGEKKSKHTSRSRPLPLECSVDRIAQIDEEFFVTGGDSGNLSLYSTFKKKPVHVVSCSSGFEEPLLPSQVSAEINPEVSRVPPPQPFPITALTAIPYSDLILSGSCDGRVRAWRISDDKKKIEACGIVGVVSTTENGLVPAEFDTDSGLGGMSPHASTESPATVRGIINDIAVFERGEKAKDGLCIVVALGKEPRLGRWQSKMGRNGAVVFEVPRIKGPTREEVASTQD